MALTQINWVLQHLLKHGSITSYEAFKLYGITRLSAKIYDLRHKYKKVIAVIDTNVKGDLYFAGSHLVSFDRNTIPFEKVKTWFKAPEGDEE